jgi:hypothetical protein
MRLNRTAALIIAIFLLVGLAMVIVPNPVLRVMGALYLLATLIAVLVVLRLRWWAHHNRWLARNGIRGQATVVSASSEMSVNEQPLVELEFDLSLPGRETRRVKRELLVAAFAARRLRPGVVLPAYVHPRDPDDILVVW